MLMRPTLNKIWKMEDLLDSGHYQLRMPRKYIAMKLWV